MVNNGEHLNKNYMSEVLFVPNLGEHNLFSVGHAISKGHRVEMKKDYAKIIDKNSGQIVALAKRRANEKVYHVTLYDET